MYHPPDGHNGGRGEETPRPESDVEAAAKKLVAVMVREDFAFDDDLPPFTRALHGLAMAVDPEHFEPIPTPIEEASARWHLDPDRLTDLVLGPRDGDGWPIDKKGATITLTEGEHWAVQEVDTIEGDRADSPAGAGHAVEADRG